MTADMRARAATAQLEAVAPDSPLARAAIAQYFAELDRRFADGFDAEAALVADAHDLRGGVFIVAVLDGEPVACGGLHALAPGVAELKRMWVHPGWRGAGLGGRMLRRLEQEARARGLPCVRLDTNSALTEAIAMYQRAGYHPIERYNDNPYARHWFEKQLPA